MFKNKYKKVCGFILMCAMVFGGIGFTQSQISTAYAMPSETCGGNRWIVWGEDSLRHELELVDKRNCYQGRENVKNIINTCIRENKKLVVTYGLDLHVSNFGLCWNYTIMW